jgi:hypothetical protein
MKLGVQRLLSALQQKQRQRQMVSNRQLSYSRQL